MASTLPLLLPLVELWLLALAALALHRVSSRLGQAPFAVFLGGLTALLQVQSLGFYRVELGPYSATLPQGSFLFLPALLFGLLLVYVVNGSSQARASLVGILLITLAVAALRGLPPFDGSLPGFRLAASSEAGSRAPWVQLASALTLLVDTVILIVVYQAVSNALRRFPSSLACGLALLAGVGADALLYPAMTALWQPPTPVGLFAHLGGKMLSALAIWPLLGVYLKRTTCTYPNSAAASPRPALDLFTTTLQLEARARYHYGLLHTLSQINQLILRSEDPQLLMDGACRLLVTQRDYLLAWIGLVNGAGPAVKLAARAGSGTGYLEGLRLPPGGVLGGSRSTTEVIQTGRAVLVREIAADPTFTPGWELALEHGFRAAAALPMRAAGKLHGVFHVYAGRTGVFDPEEIDLLQDLADDLAYALVNLETRRQNTLLFQAEHSQRQLAEALAQAAAALNSSLNLTEVLDQILEQVVRVVPCRSVNLMLVEGETARVVRILDRSEAGELRGAMSHVNLPLSTPTLQWMLQTGQPVLIPNTLRDPQWVQLEWSAWIRSYAAAPLQAGDQVIGFLNMNSDQENFFTKENTWLLLPFAANAALAIRNARYATDLENLVRERTAELSAAKERIERILVSVPDAVIVLDESDRLVQANPAGEALLAQASGEGLDLFTGEFLNALKAGTIAGEKAVLQVGERFFQALASSLPFKGLSTGVVIVFRDVTRFRALDQMKSQFVSDVSHELRTPLTNLTLYLDLLAISQDPQKNESYLATLRRETGRLTDLIEDLLTISRLEAGRVKIEMAPVAVGRLVKDLARDRTPMATRCGLALTCDFPVELPSAWADHRLVTQVLSNLLTNALIYTPAGGAVGIQCDLAPENGSTWVRVSVHDTGVGIQSEELGHLFERFYRGSASQITGAPGTGLGLAISKEIVDQLGGRITVASQPGGGSIFTVWLKAVL